jgi:uncharacterized protein
MMRRKWTLTPLSLFFVWGVAGRVATLLAAILTGWSSYAEAAPSFDCARASTQVERLICADPKLAELDSALAAAYAGRRREAPDLLRLKAEQEKWLKGRDAQCLALSDDAMVAGCVAQAYERRLADLAQRAAGPAPGVFGGFRVKYPETVVGPAMDANRNVFILTEFKDSGAVALYAGDGRRLWSDPSDGETSRPVFSKADAYMAQLGAVPLKMASSLKMDGATISLKDRARADQYCGVTTQTWLVSERDGAIVEKVIVSKLPSPHSIRAPQACVGYEERVTTDILLGNLAISQFDEHSFLVSGHDFVLRLDANLRPLGPVDGVYFVDASKVFAIEREAVKAAGFHSLQAVISAENRGLKKLIGQKERGDGR